MPEYVADARKCFAERGFAYVPHFGVGFARKFLSCMEGFNRKQIPKATGKRETLSSGGVQLFLPARPSSGQAAAAAARPAVGREWLELHLSEEWEEMSKKLAVYVGAVAEEEIHLYHLQDDKVSSASQRRRCCA
jgi:hypothetical protein